MTTEWPGWDAHIESHLASANYPAGRAEAVFDTDGLKKTCHHERVETAETIEFKGDRYAVFLVPMGPLPSEGQSHKERWTWI